MDSGFYKLYKEYPTTELLKILRMATDYQPEAVTAATQVLSERHITDEEMALVQSHFVRLETEEKAKQEKIDSYKNAVADFLQPVLQPSGEASPRYWLKFLLLVIIIEYTWSFCDTLIHLIRMFRYDRIRSIDLTDYGVFFDLLYIPVIFFLLFKKSRWGWILLFVNNLFLALMEPATYLYFYVNGGHSFFWRHVLVPRVVFEEIFRIAMVSFLWTEPISIFFNVSLQAKKAAVLAALVLTIMVQLTLAIFIH